MRCSSWIVPLMFLGVVLQSNTASAAALACADVTPGAQEGSVVPATPTSVERQLPYSDACWVAWPANNRGIAGREADEQKCNTLPSTKMLEFDPDHGENFNLCVFQSVPTVFGHLPHPDPTFPDTNASQSNDGSSTGGPTYGSQPATELLPVPFQDPPTVLFLCRRYRRPSEAVREAALCCETALQRSTGSAQLPCRPLRYCINA
jgi:hypothetical protein